ncbi:MAG: DUF58 domain-containing protein [Candidatus Nanopelagicales bacterium]
MAALTLTSTIRQRSGLTGRGWAFLASGTGLAMLGVWLGLLPAVQFGALVALLPVAAGLATHAPRRAVQLDRVMSAKELPSGDDLLVTLNVRGRLPRGRTLLIEDPAPAALGGPRRLAVAGSAGPTLARGHYRVRTGTRGVHAFGPTRVHVVDAFGMVHRTRAAGSPDSVIVLPRVVPLDPFVLGGASLGTGTGHVGALGAASDDVIPRDYRPGDEVRRIDWKASARTGSLMVRSEESPWRTAVNVVVDLHAANHHGQEPDSSLDVALSAAASVGCLALASGWDLRMRTTDDLLLFSGSPMSGVAEERRELLHTLATVPTSRSEVPSPSLRHTADATSTGPVVLIVGGISQAAAGILAGIGGHSRQRLLLVVDAWRWDADRAAGAAEPADLSLASFVAAGWRIRHIARGGDLAATWARLAGPA